MPKGNDRKIAMDANDAFLDAIKIGDMPRVRELLDLHPELVLTRLENDLSPVLAATYYGRQDVARLLAERTPDLTIYEASATGDERRVEELLRQDASLANAFASDGFQPLGLAAFFSHANTARLLVNFGADVNTPSDNAQKVTPLHSAAAAQNADIARLLLEQGADPNARQTGGFTPLHAAAENGQLDMIRLLLSYHADAALASEDGKTPADLARERGYEEAAALLGAKSQ